MMPSDYVRVTVKVTPMKRRTVWARDLTKPKSKHYVFLVVNREGDELDELIVATDTDVVKCYAAYMDKFYAELEVLKAGGRPLEIVR